MSDLNDWQLAYDAVTLNFGTEATDYPFSGQVSISDVEAEVQDAAHPTSDGLIMGRDRLRGFTLQFECVILSEYPVTTKPWMSALDLYSQFVAIWRSQDIRLTPGKYATMINTERSRMCYGRPRKIAPKMDRTRKGILDFQMDFDTNGPNWYDSLERVALLTMDSPSSSSGLHAPLIAPLSTNGPAIAYSPTVNDGDSAAWPIVEFHGPSKHNSVEMFDDEGNIAWVLKMPQMLAYDQVLTIDTRPWSRSATLDGAPANGLIRGSQLEKCTIPVGEFNLRYRTSDLSGQSFAVVRWRDTYASM